MKLLATDYDGTLKSDLKNLYLNKEVIEKFMSNGNKFAIVTGRCFKSIEREIKRHNIKYDYLSCNNGLIIFDNKNNIISASTLSYEDLIYVYNSLVTNKKVSKIELYNLYESTKNFNDILEILVKFKTVTEAKKYKEYLECVVAGIKCYRRFNTLFIGNDRSKSDAVIDIQKLENINNENIYTVGDSSNDLEMLEVGNGYKMLYSYPELWFKKYPITREVHTLVKKISK